MAGPHLRPSVVAARERLAEGRAKLRTQHDRGTPGIQVCAHQTDLVDTVVNLLCDSALEDAERETTTRWALVALGGYGRRDIAPFSDVDLMILIERGSHRAVAPFVRLLTQGITDSGLQLGASVRTPGEAVSLGLKDATIFTSMVESRFLRGDRDLFNRFLHRFRRRTLRQSGRLIKVIEESRRSERRQFGETVYLLEPNVKRSRGGLRDLQFLRWVGFARHGEADPENLERLGVLPTSDRRALRAAHEFLLQLRNELHFYAGKPQDSLSKSEQLRLAKAGEYEGTESLLAVEQLMREYIDHTQHIRYIVAHFLATAKRPARLATVVDPLFGHQVGGDFRVGPLHIRATRRGLEKVQSDLAETLRLMELSNWYNVRIDHATWEGVRTAMINRPPSREISSSAAERFLSLLSQPQRLASLLRRLHELRVLEKLVPPMEHARCLMQFNDYHKFTVDEHSIRAVEAATDFLGDDGPLGDAYRGLSDKRMLHLALLIHDLGKGYAEDHSEVGSRLAIEVGRHLRLSERETETLRFLVHRHLLMSHLAQRRDIHDASVVVQFAVEVGSTDVLQMLYLLTCADLAAVGPGVLNAWKLELITELYRSARGYLAGEKSSPGSNSELQARRERLRELLPSNDWLTRQIDELPPGYFAHRALEDTAEELQELSEIPPDGVAVRAKYWPDQKAVEFTVGAYEQLTPGIFHKLTGALTGKGLQILSAEIHTLSDQLVLDRFYVLDPDYAGEPSTERLAEVRSALLGALQGDSNQPPSFRRMWPGSKPETAESLSPLPTRIQVDNNTSEHYTILDIFAHDRMGLLYAVSRAIFEMELSVAVAKIGTYLDQVVDVFYVTDSEGSKIQDEERLAQIRSHLLEAIEGHSNVLT